VSPDASWIGYGELLFRPVADLLRIGDVAKAVGVSIDTLRRWETAGLVTFVRRGTERCLASG